MDVMRQGSGVRVVGPKALLRQVALMFERALHVLRRVFVGRARRRNALVSQQRDTHY
jgi:hypothetical protein